MHILYIVIENQLKGIQKKKARKAIMKVQISVEQFYHGMNTISDDLAGITGQEKLADRIARQSIRIQEKQFFNISPIN